MRRRTAALKLSFPVRNLVRCAVEAVAIDTPLILRRTGRTTHGKRPGFQWVWRVTKEMDDHYFRDALEHRVVSATLHSPRFVLEEGPPDVFGRESRGWWLLVRPTDIGRAYLLAFDTLRARDGKEPEPA